jgi:acyl dehydratase
MATDTGTRVELEPLDASDVDRWIGLPLGGSLQKEPFSTNDIRRYVQAMANPNPLHFDEAYAAASVFGRINAPQSYFGGGVGTGASPSIQGLIPGSHMLFGGDEFWWYGPRVYPGDTLSMDRMLFDYKVTNTSFAGPTMFSRGDTNYANQRGEFIAKQRSTSIRYLVANAQKLGAFASDTQDPEWTEEQLEKIEDEKVEYIRTIINHPRRPYGAVAVGQKLARRVLGPHTLGSFTGEQRSDQGSWGSTSDWNVMPSSTLSSGWLPIMSRNEERAKLNPGAGDGLTFGPSRGHVQPRYAREIGMPRGYGYGASMGAWCTDYLANWAGEAGFVRHARTQYRNPAFTGDVTYLDGEVTGKFVNDRTGATTAQVSYTMTNQKGAVMAKGVAEVELPAE